LPAQPDPIGADRRSARRRRKLPPDAVCVFCLETNPTVLRVAPRGLLEGHHVLGEVNDPTLIVVLCLTCHRLATEAQLAGGVVLERGAERTFPDLLESALRALAGFFRLVADAFDRWADQLGALIGALDDTCPGWRQLPEAKP
jgi:hypothetical protein